MNSGTGPDAALAASRAQILREDELANTKQRNELAQSRLEATVAAPIGTGTGIVAEFEEIIVMLSQRMRTAEDTARAVSSAASTIDAEAMLARAKAEAEAWTNGTPAARRLASEMPPMQVQAVVAERNELRAQIRSAAAQLRAIEVASGGNPLQLVKICQTDMERMAKLRAQVELEQSQQLIQLHGTQDQLETVSRQLKVADIRTITSEEQLAERAAAMVRLDRKVAALTEELQMARDEAEETLTEQLRLQHERLFAESEADKDEVCKRLVHELQEDKRAAMEATRQELDAMAENRLQTMLSEQRHTLLAQASRERAESLDGLQRELESRESRNLEALKDNLSTEHARVIKSMDARMRTVESRAAIDMQEASRQSELNHERILEDVKRELKATANRERSAALERLESNLTRKHNARVDEIQRQLLRKHADELAASSKRIEESLKKRVASEHAKELRTAVAGNTAKLTAAKKQEIEQLVKGLKQRNAAESDVAVKQATGANARQLTAAFNREKAQAIEQAKSDARVDKTSALDALRQRMITQHSGDMEMLKKQLGESRSEASSLKHEKVNQGESLMAEAKKDKQAALTELRGKMTEQAEKNGAEFRAENKKLTEEISKLKHHKAEVVRTNSQTMRADKTLAARQIEDQWREKGAEEEAAFKEERAAMSAELVKARRENVALGEKLQAINRVEKTRDIHALETRLEEHYNGIIGELKGQLAKMTSQARDDHRTSKVEASKAQKQSVTGKQSLGMLKDVLRKLLNEMKLCLVPGVVAPLDLSEASPSPAMGALTVLIKGMSLKVPDVSALADPSREAQAAPMIAFDILRACISELVQSMSAANDEIFQLRREEMREHKLLRKQVEEELEVHHRREMMEHREVVARQVEVTQSKHEQRLQSQHQRQLQSFHADSQKEVRAAKQELLSKRDAIKRSASSAASAGYKDKLLAAQDDHAAEVAGLESEAEHLKGLLQDSDRSVATMRQENHSLRDQVQRLTDDQQMNATQFLASPSPASRASSAEPSGRSSRGGASSVGSSKSEADMAMMYETHARERAISEMERLKLEKQLTNLQGVNFDLLEEIEMMEGGAGQNGDGGEY
jgi:hypothetical protein